MRQASILILAPCTCALWCLCYNSLLYHRSAAQLLSLSLNGRIVYTRNTHRATHSACVQYRAEYTSFMHMCVQYTLCTQTIRLAHTSLKSPQTFGCTHHGDRPCSTVHLVQSIVRA